MNPANPLFPVIFMEDCLIEQDRFFKSSVKEEMAISKLIDRMEDNQEIFERILEDQDFGSLVKEIMMKKVYTAMNQ